MNLGEYVKQILDIQGRSQRWLSDQLQNHMSDLDEKKLSYKLRKNSLTGEEIILIGYYLGIDLNKVKEKLKVFRICRTCKHNSVAICNGINVGDICMKDIWDDKSNCELYE